MLLNKNYYLCQILQVYINANAIDNQYHLVCNGATLGYGAWSMYVCICKGVTDSDIREAVQEGTTTVRGLREQLGCTGQCGKCKQQVREIRDAVLVSFHGVMTPLSLAVI